MTEKLYWKIPYETSFKAEVIKITEDGIILDKTLFYPEGGNQISDLGVIIIDNLELKIERVSKAGDSIVHHLSAADQKKIKKGDKVRGKIDWEYRYGIMRAHSSQHILSALIKCVYNIDTTRANIAFEEVFLQIGNKISKDQLIEVLQKFNEICTIKNYALTSKIVDKNKAKSLVKQIRGDVPDETQLRVIEIEGLDLNCCGGTHIKNSTEIGPVYLTEFRKGRNFKYLVGNTAITEFSKQNVEAVDLAQSLNAPIKEFSIKIQKQISLVSTLREKIENLLQTTLDSLSRNPTATINNINVGILEADIDYKIITKSFRTFPPDYLLIVKKPGLKLVILSNNEDTKANSILDLYLEKYGGKGGGSPKSAQGTLENDVEDFLKDLRF